MILYLIASVVAMVDPVTPLSVKHTLPIVTFVSKIKMSKCIRAHYMPTEIFIRLVTAFCLKVTHQTVGYGSPLVVTHEHRDILRVCLDVCGESWSQIISKISGHSVSVRLQRACDSWMIHPTPGMRITWQEVSCHVSLRAFQQGKVQYWIHVFSCVNFGEISACVGGRFLLRTCGLTNISNTVTPFSGNGVKVEIIKVECPHAFTYIGSVLFTDVHIQRYRAVHPMPHIPVHVRRGFVKSLQSSVITDVITIDTLRNRRHSTPFLHCARTSEALAPLQALLSRCVPCWLHGVH